MLWITCPKPDKAWRLPGRWPDVGRRSTVARWTRRRAVPAYAPIPDLTWPDLIWPCYSAVANGEYKRISGVIIFNREDKRISGVTIFILFVILHTDGGSPQRNIYLSPVVGKWGQHPIDAFGPPAPNGTAFPRAKMSVFAFLCQP